MSSGIARIIPIVPFARSLRFWGLEDVPKRKYKMDPMRARSLANFLTPMLKLDPERKNCEVTKPTRQKPKECAIFNRAPARMSSGTARTRSLTKLF